MGDEVDGYREPTAEAEVAEIHESHSFVIDTEKDSGFQSCGLNQHHIINMEDSPVYHSAPIENHEYHSMGYVDPDTNRTTASLHQSRSMVLSSTSSNLGRNSNLGHPSDMPDGQVRLGNGNPSSGSDVPDGRHRLGNGLHSPGGLDEVDSAEPSVNVDRTRYQAIAQASPLVNSTHVHSSYMVGNSGRTKRRRRKKRKPSYGRALYPEYASYRSRLESFKDWKYCHIVLPQDLAAAGLFSLGIDDKVKCFVSGCQLCNWEKADSADREHKGWFPECRYARLRHENPESLVEFDDSHAVRATLDFGYSKGVVEKAYDVMRDKGVVSPNASQILDVIFEMQKHGDPGYSSGEDIYGISSDDSEFSDTDGPNLSCEREVDIKRAHFNRAEANRLKEELVRLEKVMKCHSCKKRQSNMVNLPCGHLATCESCVYKSNRCGRCHTLIRGVVRVYMV